MPKVKVKKYQRGEKNRGMKAFEINFIVESPKAAREVVGARTREGAEAWADEYIEQTLEDPEMSYTIKSLHRKPTQDEVDTNIMVEDEENEEDDE